MAFDEEKVVKMAEDEKCHDGDPSIYFSAERTLLSWLRTGIGIMAFGFVVARFGMFLQMLKPGNDAKHSTLFAMLIGATLVLSGAAAILAGTSRFKSYCRTIPKENLPTTHATFLPVAVSIAIGVLGLLLTIQLILQ
ncbi:YidH family protein [Planctomicrobium sp. SH527]|uniref:YidH family protein n=1 Tax=Planctomicrobium sp. SH527 TaxID=3448123 RepID=UPI003F5C4159